MLDPSKRFNKTYIPIQERFKTTEAVKLYMWEPVKKPVKKGVTHEETQKDIVEQVESDTDEEDQPMEVNSSKKKKQHQKISQTKQLT